MARTSGGLVKRSYSIREDQERYLSKLGATCNPPSTSAALRDLIDAAMAAEQPAKTQQTEGEAA